MDDSDKPLPLDKPKPMKKSDWAILSIVVLLLLISFPVLWRLYRFVIPLATIGFLVYFLIRFITMMKFIELNQTFYFWKIIWNELLVGISRTFRVIAYSFIGLLIVSVLTILTFQHFSKGRETQKQMLRMTQALAKYKAELGYYPEGLATLIGNDPLKREWLQDSWGNRMDYIVTNNGKNYRLVSSGLDGKMGTDDDFILKE